VIWKKLLISLGLTLSVSLIGSLFLLNFNFNFLYSFLFFTLLQFVGFFFYGEYIRLRNGRLAVLAEVKALEEISKVTTVVTCPCDRALKTSLPLSLHKKNDYMCAGCNKKISVIIETKTALATEPMNQTQLDDPTFIQAIEQIAEKNS
jgi:hypothetical protein